MNARALAPAPRVARPQRPAADLLRWFEAEEDLTGELILSGESGRALEQIVLELAHVDRFVQAALDPPTRLLFSGPSGTGKTLTARWIGWKRRLPVAVCEIDKIVASHLGETAKHLGACFDAAVSAGAILFLDEIDGLVMARAASDSGASDELQRGTSTLLQRLDWLPPTAIVIAATNFRDKVDSALIRRLPGEVKFEAPDREARRRMLERWLGKAPVPPETLERLAEEGEGLSGAALRSSAMAEGRRALMEEIAKEPPPEKRTRKSYAAEVSQAELNLQAALEDIEREKAAGRRATIARIDSAPGGRP